MPIFPPKLALAAVLCSVAASASATPRLQRVIEEKALRVCIWPDYYGITYRNPKTRLLSGLDIDIATELGKELGVAVRYVDSSFQTLADRLVNDECDIAMHSVGITPARRSRLQFTRPTMRSDVYAIASRSSTAVRRWEDLDKPGRVIAVQAGTVMEPLMRQTLKHARLLAVEPPQTREQEVESGRADAFMTDFPYSRRMLALTDWARLVSAPAPFHMVDYAYALAPGETSLLDRVNVFIDAIRQDGRLLRFARKHQLDAIIVTH
nr:ABC transporter substrate-binding protein [uncultured Noviherbaspirillum sp.]